jgi:hypothetical protein
VRSSKASDDKDSDSDPGSEENHDSGYNHTGGESLKQRRAQHDSAGHALSNPCNATKAMIRADKRQWTR